LPDTLAVEEKLTVFENVTCAATLIEDAYDASDSMRSTIIVPAKIYSPWGIAALICSTVDAELIAVCIVAYLVLIAALAASAAAASDGMVALMSNGANSADLAARRMS
jgi:hypothetical protein